MNIGPQDMLRRLGSGLRPDAHDAPSRLSSVDSMGFADLLRSVKAGEFASGLPVRVGPEAGAELSPEQIERLAVAADAAEAAGSRRLLALMDGGVVTVDVPSRVVLASGPIESFAGAVLTDFDGFVQVPQGRAAELRAIFTSSSESAARSAGGFSGAHSHPGPGAIINPSLVAILASLASDRPSQPGETDRAA